MNIKKPSRIHGTGIFTTRDIGRGETFYRISFDKLFHEPHARCARIGEALWVSDEEVLNYVNHSCNPNAFLDLTKETPRIVARCKIKTGEEITVDYNRTEGLDATRVECNCQAQNCRGYFLRKE